MLTIPIPTLELLVPYTLAVAFLLWFLWHLLRESTNTLRPSARAEAAPISRAAIHGGVVDFRNPERRAVKIKDARYL